MSRSPLLRRLRHDRRGTTIVEFAIAAPVLIGMVLVIIQLGVLLGANAGLRAAVEDGARYATIYPKPTDSQIIARVKQKRFLLDTSRTTEPVITHGTTNGVTYADVTMSYSAPLNLVLFSTPPVTLSYTRRAYQY